MGRHTSLGTCEGQRVGIRSPGTGVAKSCKLPNMGPGIPTEVF